VGVVLDLVEYFKFEPDFKEIKKRNMPQIVYQTSAFILPFFLLLDCLIAHYSALIKNIA